MGQEERYRQVWEELFEPLAQKWSSRLKLAHWDIDWVVRDVVDDERNIDANCRVEFHLGWKAIIKLSTRIQEDPSTYQEGVVLHELLHILFARLANYVELHLPAHAIIHYNTLLEETLSKTAQILMELEREGTDENSQDHN